MVGPIGRGESSEKSPLLPESGNAKQVLSNGPQLPPAAINRYSPFPYLSILFVPPLDTSRANLKEAYQALHEMQGLLDADEARAFIDAIVGER